MKKLLALSMSLCILIAMVGCSASSSKSQMSTDAAYPPETPSMNGAPAAASAEMADMNSAPKEKAEGGLGTTLKGPNSQRKIIKNSQVTMETREFDNAMTQINALVEELGGYIEGSSMSGNSLYDSGVSSRFASITARIPEQSLGNATTKLSEIGNITSKNESASDITEAYFDVETRLKTLKIQEERYLELLKKADKMEDIISLESALTNVRYEIESLTSQQKRFDQQVSYSTLLIEVREVGDLSVVRNQPFSFGERITNAFADSLRFIGRSAQDFVIFLVSALPVLIVYGGIIAIIIFVVVKISKLARKPRKQLPPQDHTETK